MNMSALLAVADPRPQTSLHILLHDQQIDNIPRLDEIVDLLGYLEIQLNSFRSFLADFDRDKWKDLTDQNEVSQGIVKVVQSHLIRASELVYNENRKNFANIYYLYPTPEVLTRAWLKFHEISQHFMFTDHIINEFNLDMDNEAYKFRVLFLCEAPGGFISALNYDLKGKPFTWLANSLNPYNEACGPHNSTIDDTRLLEVTGEKWYFGEDNTGDITRPCFINGLTTFVKKQYPPDGSPESHKFHLITADGGMDCSWNPNLQEQASFKLIAHEVKAALSLLKSGGRFLLKIFNFFKRDTIYILYVLFSCFESCSLFKPITSKSGNSEIYVVCTRFLKKPGAQQAVDIFMKKMDQYQKDSLFLCTWEEMPLNFIYQMHEACCRCQKRQKSVIVRNIACFIVPNNQDTFTNSKKKKIAKEWLKSYPVNLVELDGYLQVKYEKELRKLYKREPYRGNALEHLTILAMVGHNPLYKLRGLIERSGRSREPVNNFVYDLYGMLYHLENTHEDTLEYTLEMFSILSPVNSDVIRPSSFIVDDLRPVYGKPIKNVYNSKFCYYLLNTIRVQVQLKKTLSEDLHQIYPLAIRSSLWFEIQHSQDLILLGSSLDNFFFETCGNGFWENDQFSIGSSLLDGTKNHMLVKYVDLAMRNNDIDSYITDNILRDNDSRRIFCIELESKASEEENCVLLLENYLRIVMHIRRQDMIIIKYNSALTRTLVQLLYLPGMFISSWFAFVPVCLNYSGETNDPNELFSLLIWTNNLKEAFTKDFEYIKSVLFEALQKILSLFGNEHKNGGQRQLLEIYPLEIILKDSGFFAAIYNANCTYWIEAFRFGILCSHYKPAKKILNTHIGTDINEGPSNYVDEASL